jgi:DNA-binding CsgD family transcriptional regulator
MDDLNRLVLDLYRSARESPIPEFHERAIATANSVCRVEAAIFATGAIHPTDGVTFHDIRLHNIADDFVSAHPKIADEDIVAWEVAKARGTVCAFNMRELMPARKYPRVAAFDAQFELQNMLGQIFLDHGTNTMNGIFLWRRRIRDTFSEGERLLGVEILPHLIEATTINRAMCLSELTEGTIARRGVRAIADAHGLFIAHDEPFFALMRTEWPDWSPPALPRALLAALQSVSVRQYHGARISVAAEAKRDMLFLLAREKHGGSALSPSQLAVARLVARGYTNKEAAAELGRSERTVRNQLHDVFRKLGLRNRVELAERLRDLARSPPA